MTGSDESHTGAQDETAPVQAAARPAPALACQGSEGLCTERWQVRARLEDAKMTPAEIENVLAHQVSAVLSLPYRM